MLVNMTRVFCNPAIFCDGAQDHYLAILIGFNPLADPQELDHFNYTWTLHTCVPQNWKTLLYIIISCIYIYKYKNNYILYVL